MEAKPELIKSDPVASAIWDYYKARLEEAGKWRDEYAASFTVLVDAVNGFLVTSATLAKPDNLPILVNPVKGTSYRNPLLDIKAQYVNTILRYGAAFGLSPLADARLKATPPEAIGELFKFLTGPGVGG